VRNGGPANGRRLVAVLPTLCTLGNVLCGFFAIFWASRPISDVVVFGWTPLVIAAFLIYFGMLFDGLDGRVARLTGQTSKFGEQLDSMADMVTFGLAPAFLAVRVIGVGTPLVGNLDTYLDRLAIAVAGIFVACAALRLARYNVEAASVDEDKDPNYFNGLPSPGAAGAVAGAALLHQHFEIHHYFGKEDPSVRIGLNPAELPVTVTISAVTIVIVLGLCALAMVSSFRYVHVMNRYIRGRDRFENIVKIVVAVLLFSIEPFVFTAVIFGVYAASAPAVWMWQLLWRGGAAVKDAAIGGDEAEKRAG